MEIFTAKSAGFCFGVKRAVDFVYKKSAKTKIYTYGPIIHNKKIIDDLQKRGVAVIESLENVSGGEVVIRSHGVGENIYRELEQKGIAYSDCTCPFVKKIHEIVHRSCKSKNIIIVGNPEHPEVIGINGWCKNSAVIVNSVQDAENFIPTDGKYVLVVQTTFNKAVFEEIKALLCKKADIKVFDTICSATSSRQQETIKLAKQVDVMIVLGDRGSSNTQKLFSISKEINPNTFFCQSAEELDMSILQKNLKIGITAGASAPPAIIKEVFHKMSENNENFEEMFEESYKELKEGETEKGTVIKVEENAVYVNVNGKTDGVIYKDEFSSDPDVVLADEVKVGEEIEVYILKISETEVLLSKKKADSAKNIKEIEEAYYNKTTLRGKVRKVVKSGFIVDIKGESAFVPYSQISNRFVEDLKSFVGQELEFNIIDFDKNNRYSRTKIVAGRKELIQKEIAAKKEAVMNSLVKGSQVEGIVSRITSFGAFIDLGGVDGLVHISEVAWSRVKNVSDVLSVGDKVKVTVLDVNKEKGKISLSLKNEENNPWNNVDEKYPIGSIIEGKVVRLVTFGAFVELEPGVDGLVHISQISNKRVEKTEDVLEVDQIVPVKVVDIDMEKKKISLSIKEAGGIKKAEEIKEAKENGESEESAEIKE